MPVHQRFRLCVYMIFFAPPDAKLISFSLHHFFFSNFDLSSTELPISITYKKIIINIKVCKVFIYTNTLYVCVYASASADAQCLYMLQVMQNIEMCDPFSFFDLIWFVSFSFQFSPFDFLFI